MITITDAARIESHFRVGRRAHRATADRTDPPRRCGNLLRLGTSPNHPWLGRSLLHRSSPPPAWDDAPEPMPEWDLLAQPAPDFGFDQRITW
jgi:hypothetical protein